jgi:hypothetical protein
MHWRLSARIGAQHLPQHSSRRPSSLKLKPRMAAPASSTRFFGRHGFRQGKSPRRAQLRRLHLLCPRQSHRRAPALQGKGFLQDGSPRRPALTPQFDT